MASCRPQANSASQATMIPFPTVTPGQEQHGLLATQDRFGASLANPATAAALLSQPSATPSLGTCPDTAEAELPETAPSTLSNVSDTLLTFLNAGGSPNALERTLREWQFIQENGFVLNTVDLTGEGLPELILSFTDPEGQGVLLIFGCVESRYTQQYRSIGDEAAPPEIVIYGDMNLDFVTDLVYTITACNTVLNECDLQTQVIGWQSRNSQFISLLGTNIESSRPPEVRDIDGDQIIEIILHLTSKGNNTTGPLRTGLLIYDWDGTVYNLSIVQLDPPTYRIQIIHEADRYFQQSNMAEATRLYQEALNNEVLEDWFVNEAPFLDAYVLYRLLLTRAVVGENTITLSGIFQALIEKFPNPDEGNIYVDMARTFWDTYQLENNVSNACLQVQAVIADRPEAIDLLNEYGNRSPIYTTHELCPY